MLRARFVCILPLSLLACITGQRPPRADVSCSGAVSCGREQLVQADQSLEHAIEQRGVAAAFSDVLLDDANLLREGQGLVSGKQRAIAAVAGFAPFTWTLARADVSADAQLGYSFGWMARGHYAAVWRRRGGDWKLAVFLEKPAEPQDTAPPAWFAPLRGEREAPPLAKHSVAAADTAFASFAKQVGTQTAFDTYAAQDAVHLARTMVFGREAIHQLFTGAPLISWGPVIEDAAHDLGYTIGAYTAGEHRGNYLTIWRLQTDGSWRYILDAGVSG